MSELTEINIYGQLGEKIGQSQWHLMVSSVVEAFHAININSNRKFYKYLLDEGKRKAKYKILIDEEELDLPEKELSEIGEEELLNAVNVIKIKKNIKRIDLIPVIEGGAFVPIIVGLLMIAAGIGAEITITWLVIAGLGLVMTGVAMLLAKPPDFGAMREIQQVDKKDSYLFSGPVNYLGEGGPVPIGYGQLIVGSLGIQLNYITEDRVAFIQDEETPTESSVITEILAE